jgi:hypothetical protein
LAKRKNDAAGIETSAATGGSEAQLWQMTDISICLDGALGVQGRWFGHTVWLTQRLMAGLYQVALRLWTNI